MEDRVFIVYNGLADEGSGKSRAALPVDKFKRLKIEYSVFSYRVGNSLKKCSIAKLEMIPRKTGKKQNQTSF